MPWLSGDSATANETKIILAAVVAMTLIAIAGIAFGYHDEVSNVKGKEGCDYYADRVLDQVPAKCVRHFTETSK